MTSPRPTSSTGEPNFQIFSSLIYSPLLTSDPANTAACGGEPSPFYLLPYHRDRLVSAAKHFNWPQAVESLSDLDAYRSACSSAVDNFLASDEGFKYAQSHEKDEDDGGKADIPLKIRTLVSHDGKLNVEVYTTQPVHHPNLFPKSLGDPDSLTDMFGFGFDGNMRVFNVRLDSQGLRPGPFTKFKTTSRAHYEAARRRAGISTFAQPDEVLLWNSDDDDYSSSSSSHEGGTVGEGPMGERSNEGGGLGNGRIMEGSITNVYFYRPERGGWITPSVDGDHTNSNSVSAGGTGGTVRRWLLEQNLVTVGDIKKDEVVDGEWVWISNGVRGMSLGKVVL